MFRLVDLFRKPINQKIIKSTAIYTGGNVVNKITAFALIPILTRFLTPEDYGLLATFVAILGIIQIVTYMGTTDAVVRAYFDKHKPGFEFSKYVFNAFLVNFSVFLIIIAFWYLFKSYLVKIIPISFNYQFLIPLMGFFISVCAIPSKLLIMMKKPMSHTIFNSSGALLELVLSISFVVLLGFGWKGRIGGIFLTKFLLSMAGIAILAKYKYLKISLNVSYLKDVFKYGFPVMLHSIGFVVIVAIDRFFLNKFIGLSVTGIYSVSFSICSIIAFSTTAFSFALTPFVYEKLDNPTEILKMRLVKYTYLYFFLVLTGVFLFIYFIPYVMSILVGNKFLGAKIFIFWLALGFGFHSMYTMVIRYIFYERKTYILSFIAIVTITLSVILNYILIKLNGAVGVAQATCLVFLSRFLLVWYFSNRVYPMPWFSFARVQLK